MCDISLATNTCEFVASCGISVRFQTLSPSHRQIAHALLTRPPLITPRRVITVRLECVKHAASVHPEPGSNSLKNCISSNRSSFDSVFQSYLSQLLLLQYFVFKVINEIFISFSQFVVQFSRTVVFATLVSSAHVVQHTPPKMSIPFFKFFYLF